MDLLVAYDIGDTQRAGAKRLREVHHLCSEYGTAVQLSVFEFRLTPTRFAALRYELERLIDPRHDCVHIYHFTRPLPDSKTVLGAPRGRDVGDAWML